MRKKRVLLLSEGFGTGHTQAAYALAVGLRQLSPRIQTRVIELGTFLNPIIGPLILSAYRKTVSKQPKLVGRMYRSGYHKSLNRMTQFALHRLFYNQVADVVRQLKPDSIVCTHPVPNAVVSRLKRLGLDVPLYTLITDYDAHASWTNPEVNTYLVSTLAVRNKLIARGVPPTSIEVTGIPVHPNFWHPHDRAEILAQFHLKDMPTVLIMGGGWGLLYGEELVEYMAAYADRVQLIHVHGQQRESAREAALRSAIPASERARARVYKGNQQADGRLGFARHQTGWNDLHGRHVQRNSDALLRAYSRVKRKRMPNTSSPMALGN